MKKILFSLVAMLVAMTANAAMYLHYDDGTSGWNSDIKAMTQDGSTYTTTLRTKGNVYFIVSKSNSTDWGTFRGSNNFYYAGAANKSYTCTSGSRFQVWTYDSGSSTMFISNSVESDIEFKLETGGSNYLTVTVTPVSSEPETPTEKEVTLGGSWLGWGSSTVKATTVDQVATFEVANWGADYAFQFVVDGTWYGKTNADMQNGVEVTAGTGYENNFTLASAAGKTVTLTFNVDTKKAKATWEGTTTPPTPDPDPVAYSVSYDNSKTQWAEVYAYVWNSTSNANVAAWPGTKMTAPAEGSTVWTYSFSTAIDPSHIIFNDGTNNDDNKTADLDFVDKKVYGEADDTPVAPDPEPVDYSVSYDNAKTNWAEVYAYVWNSTSNANVAAWPGTKMTAPAEGSTVWTYSFSTAIDPSHIIFNDGTNNDDRKTADLDFVDKKVYGEADDTPVTPDPESVDYSVSYDNGETNWAEVYAYVWNSTSNAKVAAWPGTKMTAPAEGSTVWTYSFSTAIDPSHIIFNDGTNNDDNKTADLDFVDKKVYGEADDTPVTPDPESVDYSVSFNNAISGWTEVYAYVWNSTSNAYVAAWPGTKMTPDADGIVWTYTFSTAIDPSHIIFNDGTNNDDRKTADLDFSEGLYGCPDVLYLAGKVNGTNWSTSAAIAAEGVNGVYQWSNVVIDGHFSFLTKNGDDWDETNSYPRVGAVERNQELDALSTVTTTVKVFRGSNAKNSNAWVLGLGNYDIMVNLNAMTLVVEKVTDGVEVIESGAADAAIYYNLQGVKVNKPERGIFIVVRGDKVSKEYIR